MAAAVVVAPSPDYLVDLVEVEASDRPEEV